MGRPRKDGIEPRPRGTTPESYVIQFTATLATGERKRISIVRASKPECLAEYKRLTAEEAQGKLIAKSGTTVEQWMNNWLDNYKKLEVEVPTYIGYAGSIKNHIIPAIGTIALQKLTTGNIQKMIGKLSKDLQPGTVHKVYATLSQGLQQAVDEGIIHKNPAKAARLPKNERTNVKQKVLTNEELLAIISVASSKLGRNKCFYPALLLMIETGARRGEIFGLKWTNVDFKNNQILIKDTVYDDRGHIKPKNKPKNISSIRQLPLSQTMMDILGSMERRSEYVFSTERGTILNPKSFYVAFTRWCEKAKIPKHSPHDLRHTFITDMVNSGESITTIQGFTGHSNVTTLLNVYAHKITSEVLSAAERKHERMNGIMQHASVMQHNLKHKNSKDAEVPELSTVSE